MELSCPQCGLTLAMRGPQIEYCPRCIAKRRQPVPLVAEALKRRAAPKRPDPTPLAERTRRALRARREATDL
jgi:hypothetical protein